MKKKRCCSITGKPNWGLAPQSPADDCQSTTDSTPSFPPAALLGLGLAGRRDLGLVGRRAVLLQGQAFWPLKCDVFPVLLLYSRQYSFRFCSKPGKVAEHLSPVAAIGMGMLSSSLQDCSPNQSTFWLRWSYVFGLPCVGIQPFPKSTDSHCEVCMCLSAFHVWWWALWRETCKRSHEKWCPAHSQYKRNMKPVIESEPKTPGLYILQKFALPGLCWNGSCKRSKQAKSTFKVEVSDSKWEAGLLHIPFAIKSRRKKVI